ncbi:PAS domain S-box protein [Roseateles sp. YR242]|uniref:PAS domain S-box protein n=1 Tax=Roseateles sp. YR242 TaxID=1855305 RepID=UPI00210072D8|nr:PAS domain S-box protein [Roseateles sp. YR242]
MPGPQPAPGAEPFASAPFPPGIDAETVFRSLFVASPDGILLVDAKGVILLASPSAERLLGYDPGTLAGLHIEVLVPDSIRPRHAEFREGYGQAPRARPMGTQMDLVAKRRDGTEVMVEIALSPLQSHGLPYVMASVRGIGEYPRVRQALQRARCSEHLAALGKLAVDSRDPQEILRQVPAIAAEALELQTAMLHLLDPGRTLLHLAAGVGLGGDELLGERVPWRIDSPEGLVLTRSQALQVPDLRQEQRFPVAQALALGRLSLLAVPVSDRGKVVGALTVWSSQAQRFGDAELRFMESVANLLGTCLQRAQTEEALSHSQRLEAVGQLTGGIAHDFNNLLTVIQGNLQVLADLPVVAEDAVAPQLVAAATRASRRGADLTGKLLAFSRRQVLQPTAVDVEALLRSLADMLRRTLDQRIRIQVQVAADCPDVLADPGQLESAVLNIAINARDAMPEGGELIFAASAVQALTPELRGELSLDPAAADPGYVCIAVSDTGTGMPEAVKERAFEPFFTTKQAGRGTGLGLSTVYGFARQSQGTVLIDSESGRGTVLSILLPQPPDEALEAARTALPLARDIPPGARVLLVEDDAEVRLVARRFLKDLGCNVTACANGEEAVAWLHELRGRGEPLPACVLSDVALGAGMRGTELARQVQATWPEMRILLTSGFSADLLEGASEWPWALLPKPYNRPELAEALARVLRD